MEATGWRAHDAGSEPVRPAERPRNVAEQLDSVGHDGLAESEMVGQDRGRALRALGVGVDDDQPGWLGGKAPIRRRPLAHPRIGRVVVVGRRTVAVADAALCPAGAHAVREPAGRLVGAAAVAHAERVLGPGPQREWPEPLVNEAVNLSG